MPQPDAVAPTIRAAARRALALDPDALLATCREEFLVAGGPGGQHRNKSATGVRLVHAATATVVTATERRSQAQNRAEALRRLRERLARLAREPRPRRPTRPGRAATQRRLDAKRRLSAKKARRRGAD